MKKAMLIIVFMFITTSLFADRVDIPFSCYPKKIQAAFAERGKKLDLSANDRTDDSWGFIESKGSNYSIYTYEPLDIPKELEEIQKIVSER